MASLSLSLSLGSSFILQEKKLNTFNTDAVKNITQQYSRFMKGNTTKHTENQIYKPQKVHKTLEKSTIYPLNMAAKTQMNDRS
jgi:hypothetical protein